MSSAMAIRAGQAFVEVFANTSKLASGLRQAQAQVKAFATKMQSVGTAMAKMGGVGLAPLWGAAKMFGEFERQMLRVKSIIEPTAEDFASLNQEALRIGRETAFSSSEAAQAMVQFAQAGFTVKEILAATAPTMKLAASNQMELTQATGAAITVLRGMALDSGELTRTLEALGTVASATYTDVGLLASGFSYFAADARAAGMGVADVAALLGVFSDEGKRGEVAGTTGRAILADLKNLTPQAAAELKRLGVVLADGNNNWRKPEAIFSDLAESISNMGSYARDTSLSRIFDTRSGSGAEIFLRNIEKFISLRNKARSNSGLLDRMEATQMDSFYGSWKILTSALEGFALAVGKELAPLMREWGAVIISVTNRLTKWAEANPEAAQTLAKLSAGLLIGGAALAAFGLAVGAMAPALGAMAAAFAFVAKAALFVGVKGAIAGTLGALLALTDGGQAALRDFGSTFLAIGSQIGESAKRIWGDINEMAQGIGDALVLGDWEAAGQMAALGLKAVWAEMWESLKAGAFSALASIGASVVQVFNEAIAQVQKLFVRMWRYASEGWAYLKDQFTGPNTGASQAKITREHNEWQAKQFALINRDSTGRAEQISQSLSEAVKQHFGGVAQAGQPYREQMAALAGDLGVKRFAADMDGMVNEMLKGLSMKAGKADAAAKAAGTGGLGGVGKGESVGTFFGYLAGQMGATSVNDKIADNTKRAADALDRIGVGMAAGQVFG